VERSLTVQQIISRGWLVSNHNDSIKAYLWYFRSSWR